MYRYKTKGTCSREIIFDIEDDMIKDVEFVKGCMGNTTGVAVLAKNRPVDEVISLLEGIDCGGRGTSCPDQLARALKLYKQKQASDTVEDPAQDSSTENSSQQDGTAAEEKNM